MSAWEPMKHKVGDRVRVRLSGECMFRCPKGHDWHKMAIDGAIGVINADSRRLGEQGRCTEGGGHIITGVLPTARGHFWAVVTDHGKQIGWYATVELEPLT